jgi:hypothetical protein
MSRKKPKSPSELLQHNLSARPQGTRCALVLDPDRIVELGRTLTDDKGRPWDVVIYRGDDVVTRRAWQRALNSGRPVALVLSRGEGDNSVLDIGSIADLVSRAEGEMIDLSTLGYFHSLFPRVNPPPQTLAEHRQDFLDNVEGIIKAYPRFKERWGEPDSWTRGHFLAILLLARFPGWTLDDLWCNEREPAALAAHAVALLCHPDVTPADLPALAEVIWESARLPRATEGCRWLDVQKEDLEAFRAEVAAYLVVRDLLAARPVAHVDALLKAKLSPYTFDPEEVGPAAPALLGALKETGRWGQVHTRAQEFLTPARLEKVADLLQDDPDGLARVAESPETAPVVLAFLARQAILARCQGGNASWPAWVRKLRQHPLVVRLERGEILAPQERTCAALLSAAAQLETVEGALAESGPVFSRAEELLDWYTATGRHLLEYGTAEAFARLETVEDAALHSATYAFIMKPPQGLRYRVRQYFNGLDRGLADFVAADPNQFQQGPRSALRIIPEVVRGAGRARNRRVWVLVMDGMRYDTWDAVVRPLLLEHFEVVAGQDRAYYSLLPSKTDIARRGLLAANLGKDWKNYFNRPTKDERILVARALGVSKHEVDTKILFVADAETTQARAKMGYDSGEARDVNVLIYPVSDDLGHHHNDTLAALNSKIRQQLLTQQGLRGIVDDLRQRVQPGDLMLVTSDHGFQELFPEECVPIRLAQALQQGKGEEEVAYRYLKFAPGKGWPLGDHVVLTWEELSAEGRKQQTTFTLPVGGAWYQREKGRPARYAHGGVSLAEMTIPGVLLQPIVQKTARLEFLELPEEITIAEDQTGNLQFAIVNRGNMDTAYELKVRTNLDEQLWERSGTLPSGKREQVTFALTGRYQTDLNRNLVPSGTLTAVFVELAHTDPSGKLIRPPYGRQTVRVSVKPKAAKVETDALKAFDEL